MEHSLDVAIAEAALVAGVFTEERLAPIEVATVEVGNRLDRFSTVVSDSNVVD